MQTVLYTLTSSILPMSKASALALPRTLLIRIGKGPVPSSFHHQLMYTVRRLVPEVSRFLTAVMGISAAPVR